MATAAATAAATALATALATASATAVAMRNTAGQVSILTYIIWRPAAALASQNDFLRGNSHVKSFFRGGGWPPVPRINRWNWHANSALMTVRSHQPIHFTPLLYYYNNILFYSLI